MKVSIVLFKSDGKDKHNCYPVKLVVSHGGKKVRSTISKSALIDWDAKNNVPLITHPGYDVLYPEILTIRARAFDRYVRDSEDMTSVLAFVLNQSVKIRYDFYAFACTRIIYMKSQEREGNAIAYQSAVDQFKIVFPDLQFSEIDANLIERFKEFKKTEVKTLNTGALKRVKNATIRRYLQEIRAIYNAGVKYYGIVDKYPFKAAFNDLPVPKRSVRHVFLDTDRIKKLENSKGLPQSYQRALDLTLLQFYLGGVDMVDLYYLKWSQLVNGRVYLKRGKLGAKAEEFDIKVFEKAQKIIDKYGSQESVYVFPWSKDRTRYTTFRNNVVRDLRIVLKKLEIDTLPKNAPIATKSMRHSFRTIAKFLFIDVDIVRELMGHERKDIDTIYADKYPEKTRDEAHFKIIE
mgnify:FL=1|tara:strand:+ start:4225 stop:5439 length:1215 start_codon:yes stop_codon:yes gene_type:complete